MNEITASRTAVQEPLLGMLWEVKTTRRRDMPSKGFFYALGSVSAAVPSIIALRGAPETKPTDRERRKSETARHTTGFCVSRLCFAFSFLSLKL
jgi:hypothetical protein